MDLAEAMLRPVDDDLQRIDEATPAASITTRPRGGRFHDDWLTEPLFAAEASSVARTELRPASLDRADRSALGPVGAHPHRRPARLERSRRPGAISRPAQPCVSPLPAPARSTFR